jgi:hypothetical protein
MPNWPLSQEIRDHIRDTSLKLANRMVDLNRLGFPLDVQQIQIGASGLTVQQIESLKQLKKEGVETIRQTNEIRVGFLREVFPELKRSLTLTMCLPRSIYYRHGHYTLHEDQRDFKPGTQTHLPATLGNLTAEERAALIAWLEKLLKQVRMYEVVTHCVRITIASEITPTAGHLKYLWPTLTTVVDPGTQKYHHQRDRLDMWIERFRNPPMRGISRYQNDHLLFTRYKDLLKVADLQITGGRMLSPVTLDQPGAIYPVIDNWERIPGDITFPLRAPT